MFFIRAAGKIESREEAEVLMKDATYDLALVCRDTFSTTIFDDIVFYS